MPAYASAGLNLNPAGGKVKEPGAKNQKTRILRVLSEVVEMGGIEPPCKDGGDGSSTSVSD